MSHIARQPSSSLQGVEKAVRAAPKPLGNRTSNASIIVANKGAKVIRSTAGIAVKNERKEGASFNVYLDENGESELNVVRQLERIQPPRVPLASLVDDEVDEDEPSCSPSFSMGEGSEYFSVPSSLPLPPVTAFDTPAEMVHDMFEYMQMREEEFLIRLRWDKQPELNESMRAVLIDWLHDVLIEYNMESETLHLTASLIDRLLMMCSVSRPNVQLVGTAALMIASKYEQIYPPELKDFVYITDDSYTDTQILRMEHKILNYLRFDISVPTVEWFVSHLLNSTKPGKKVSALAHYLGDLSLLSSSSLSGMRPSLIAASSLALSHLIVGLPLWPAEMEEATGIKLVQMEAPMKTLLKAFNDAPHSEQRSFFEKYSSEGKDGVSLLQAPSTLPPLH